MLGGSFRFLQKIGVERHKPLIRYSIDIYRVNLLTNRVRKAPHFA